MKVELRHWELQPEEIIRKRFSSKLDGVNRREVREVLSHIAAALDSSREKLTLHLLDEAALKRALRECETTIGALKRQLGAANEQLQAYEEAAQVLRETRALAEQALDAAEHVLRTRLKGIEMEAVWMAEWSRNEFSEISMNVDHALSVAIAAMQGALDRFYTRAPSMDGENENAILRL